VRNQNLETKEVRADAKRLLTVPNEAAERVRLMRGAAVGALEQLGTGGTAARPLSREG